MCFCVCVLPWGTLCKGVTSINIVAQRDGGPADLKQGTCPSLPYMSPLCSSGLKGYRGEDLERVSPFWSLPLTSLWESQDSCGPPAHPHTSTERKTQRGGLATKKRELSCGGRRSDLNLAKIIRRILSLPVERRANLGEGWQKGERERRRFSSCERWVLLTLSSWGGLTCMLSDDEEMCDSYYEKEK